jgi:hypothetical protein
MQKIPLHLARKGMVLAREVSRSDNSSNIPLCGKDVVLTDELIKRFDRVDIQYIYVQGRPVKLDGEATLESMLEGLEQRFEKVRNQPLMDNIFEVYAAHIRQSMER